MSKFKFNVTQTAALLAVLTLISKLIGFIREMLMANYYGTTYVANAYVLATSIPGIVFGGIFGAISVAYMPIFSTTAANNGPQEGDRFTSAIINLLMISSLFSSAIGIIFAEQIVSTFFSKLPQEAAILTIFYLKISFTFLLFTSIGGILDAYLQYKGSFLLPVIAGYFQNLGMISVLMISACTSHYYLMFGLLLGYALRALVQLIFTRKHNFKYLFKIRSGGNTRKIIFLALPVFIGSAGGQISGFVDKTFASSIPGGAISALGYGSLVVGLIAGLTTVILTTMIYPRFAQAGATKDYDRLGELLSTGITLTCLIALPCTLGGMAYSKQIIQIIFERGAFDPNSTYMTSIAFFYYVIGLSFGAIGSILVYCFYSLHDTKTPLFIGLISVSVDIFFNFILIKPMGLAGLALSTSIGGFTGMILFYVMLRRKHRQIKIIKSIYKLMKICFASIVSVGTSILAYNYAILPIKHILYPRIIQLGLAVFIAVMVYYLLLYLMKIEEIGLIKLLAMKRK